MDPLQSQNTLMGQTLSNIELQFDTARPLILEFTMMVTTSVLQNHFGAPINFVFGLL